MGSYSISTTASSIKYPSTMQKGVVYVYVFQVGRGGIHIGLHLTIHNHWYMTQILMVTFLTVISLTLLCMVTDILWGRTTSYITSHQRVYNRSWKMRTMERVARDYNKDVSSESDDDTCTSGANNIGVQKTIGFIRSLVTKLVTDKMPSPIRHDSSEQLPLLDCVYVCVCVRARAIKTTNGDIQISPHVFRFKLRLWWIN